MKPTTLALLATLLLPAAPAALSAQDLAHPLTPEQVECEMEKLRGLLFFSQAASEGRNPPTVLASPGLGSTVGVLALRNQWEALSEGEPLDPSREPEVHLAATLTPTMSTLLLNPERPRLDKVALVVDDPGTTLIMDRLVGRMVLVMQASEPDTPRSLLTIDNDRRGGATRPGRPLREAGIVRDCGSPLTEEDRLVLAALQRMVRPRFQGLMPGDINGSAAAVAIYRAQESDAFWLDFYVRSFSSPAVPEIAFVPIRLRLAVERDDQGRLDQGLLELVDLSPGSFSLPEAFVELFFARPVLPGVEVWSEDEPPTVRLDFPEAFDDGPVEIDLAALLADTTWNPPRTDAEPGG